MVKKKYLFLGAGTLIFLVFCFIASSFLPFISRAVYDGNFLFKPVEKPDSVVIANGAAWNEAIAYYIVLGKKL